MSLILAGLRLVFGSWLSWAILAGFVATGWYFVNDYQHRGNTIAVLQDREKGYKSAVLALKKNAEQAQATLKAAEDARSKFKVDTEKMCAAWEAVKDSETPVLDLLEELKKREAAKPKAKP